MDLTHLSMCVLLLVFVSLQIQIRQTYNSGYICTETGGAPVRTVSLTSTAKKSRVIRSHLQPSSEAITISTANITMAMLRFMHSTHFLPIQAFGQANLVIQMICILWSSYKFTMDLRWPDFICIGHVWHWTICPWTERETGLYVVLYPESTQNTAHIIHLCKDIKVLHVLQ